MPHLTPRPAAGELRLVGRIPTIGYTVKLDLGLLLVGWWAAQLGLAYQQPLLVVPGLGFFLTALVLLFLHQVVWPDAEVELLLGPDQVALTTADDVMAIVPKHTRVAWSSLTEVWVADGELYLVKDGRAVQTVMVTEAGVGRVRTWLAAAGGLQGLKSAGSP